MMWIIRRKLSIIYSKILYYLLKNITLILLLNFYWWTEEEKRENSFCKDGVTLTGRDGLTYCHSNAEDEEEEEEVQCGVCG